LFRVIENKDDLEILFRQASKWSYEFSYFTGTTLSPCTQVYKYSGCIIFPPL